jgi:uncharacterized membrane protein
MNAQAVESAAGFTFVARRNNSLSSDGRFLVLGSIAVVLLAISLGFATVGAWLVVPFAGIEILVVYLAFRYVERSATDYECIAFDQESIVIERQLNGRSERYQLNRHWAHIAPTNHQSGKRDRFVLRSHGKEVELGLHLPGAQRAAHIRRLIEHLKSDNKGTLGEA